jgi:hypothetical protein
VSSEQRGLIALYSDDLGMSVLCFMWRKISANR